jgi:hypothetical protein
MKIIKIQEIKIVTLAHGNTLFIIFWVLNDVKKEYSQEWSWIEKHVMLNTNVVCNKKSQQITMLTQL